jgi:hypothetical protein
MANTDNANGFTWVKNLAGGGVPELIPVTQATTQTITKGDALELSSGQAIVGTSSSGTILGVAAQSQTTTTATATLLIYPATPWNVFEAQTSGTYAASIRHSAVDIEGATGVMEVNENGTTEKVFQVIGENPNTEIGANSRVWGVFVRSSFLDLQDAE